MFYLFLLLIIIAAGIAMFKKEWATKAIVALTAAAAALATWGEQIMALIPGFGG